MNDTVKLSDPTFAYTKRPVYGRYLVAEQYISISENAGFVVRESPTKWRAVTNDSPRSIGIYKTLKAAVKAIENYYRVKEMGQ